jgi:methionyl aminopeptidase
MMAPTPAYSPDATTPGLRSEEWDGAPAVRPGLRSCARWNDGTRVMAITIKSKDELKIMREAGRVVAETLQVLVEMVKPGTNVLELDEAVRREYSRRKVVPTFLGYPPGSKTPFPATVCVSINDEIVHGIPRDYVMKDGDIVSIDLGATYKGYVGDAAVSVICGTPVNGSQELVDTCRDALWAGIEQTRSGRRLGDVGYAVQSYAEQRGYGVVREYVGHGVGRRMHEDPQVPNYGKPGHGFRLKPGLVIAIEPMVNMGDWHTKKDDDDWTIRTLDGSLSAHFEHTVAVTPDGPLVLTLP